MMNVNDFKCKCYFYLNNIFLFRHKEDMLNLFYLKNTPPTPVLKVCSRPDKTLYLPAIDDLEFFSFPEAEVIFCTCFIVIKCYKEGDSCKGDRMSASALDRLAGENEACTHAEVNMLHSSHACIDRSVQREKKTQNLSISG